MLLLSEVLGFLLLDYLLIECDIQFIEGFSVQEKVEWEFRQSCVVKRNLLCQATKENIEKIHVENWQNYNKKR